MHSIGANSKAKFILQITIMYKFMSPQSQLQKLYQIKDGCIINYEKKWKEGISSHVVKDYFMP